MRNLFFILLCITTLVQAQKPTNKREIMQQFLDGTLDKSYVPSAFFMHFGKDAKVGENAINAHLRYFLSTGMDFVKIQFEQGMDVFKLKSLKIGIKSDHFLMIFLLLLYIS